MYVRRLSYILYRRYAEKGYLTDNRNFGYDTYSKSCIKVGDLLLSNEGSVFYSMLDDKFQDINDIVYRLQSVYKEIPYDVIYEDAVNFYLELSSRGFILCVQGDNNEQNIPLYFSYKRRKPVILKVNNGTPIAYDNIFGCNYSLSRVHVDVSSRCNENCVHCYIPPRDKMGIMTMDMFDKVLAQCISMKVLNITLSGGEPMLNPFLSSFIRKCTENNFSINILSNLTYLTDELLEIIVSNPLISVQTSLYAMQEDIHDGITRTKGSFQKTIKAIQKLYSSNVPLQINCPIMKQNLYFYNDVVNFATSLNVEVSYDYSLFGCYDSSKVNIGCRISKSDVVEILKKRYSDRNNLMEAVQHTDKDVNAESAICPICKSSLCISNIGDVYPCEGLQRVKLGNINVQTLEYIWEKSSQVNYLRNLKYNDFRKCSECGIRAYCTSCLIMNANDSMASDFMEVSPYLCELAQAKKMILETLNCH